MTPGKMAHLAGRWRRMIYKRELLFAFAAGWIAVALLLPQPSWVLGGAILVFGIVLIARLAVIRPWRFDADSLVRQINRSHPELEESSALWLRQPDSLSLLERLQRRRIDTVYTRRLESEPRASLGEPAPGSLRAALFSSCIAFLCFIMAFGLFSYANRSRRHLFRSAAVLDTTTQHAGSEKTRERVLPRIKSAELTVTPPAYTGKPVRRITGFNGEIEEGSLVLWRVALDQPVREARLVFGQGKDDALPLINEQDAYQAQRTAHDSGLYHLAATLSDGTPWTPPEVYALKVIKDVPPIIKILQPAEARTQIDSRIVSIEVVATDDYAVASAHIVATVAKGSGEAVKFREQSIAFDDNGSKDQSSYPANTRQLSKTLDLDSIGMEPGDELYFYVEATDNRQPTPNRARSETRFVVLKGPESKAPSSGQGVAGVNLVPQYFRSERQIIIDTEKLIAERPTLRADEFNRRSNDLGIDQQLLRLRYGQFLGEELEQGQGSGDQTEVNLNPLQRGVPRDMMHEHDTAPEGTTAGAAGTDPRAAARTALRLQLQHTEQAAGHADEHDPPTPADNTGGPLTAAEVIAPFVDEHDAQDTATFFDREKKSTMRDALAAMWDAEKFLRTNRPPEALAPANKALAILKDIQQSARAYVQHVGFEPAPLKIDLRRLQGNVSDVNERVSSQPVPAQADPALTAVRRLLQAIPWHSRIDGLAAQQTQSLHEAEPALTAAATRQPDLYLAPLQTVRRLVGPNPSVSEQEAAELEKALLRLLPPATAQPGRQEDLSGGSARYFQALGEMEATP